MRISILGRSYQLRFCRMKLYGECDEPSQPRKSIKINRALKDLDKLETLIHEMLHAADWSKDEKWVDQTAKDIAAVLWKLGYREKVDD